MARLPRVVAAGHPHHVTQRGNRRLREGVMGVPGIAGMAQWRPELPVLRSS